jgi:hypothetical protein
MGLQISEKPLLRTKAPTFQIWTSFGSTKILVDMRHMAGHIAG